jgi:hypothetical protein
LVFGLAGVVGLRRRRRGRRSEGIRALVEKERETGHMG